MNELIKRHIEGYKYREENYKYCFDLENWRTSESYALIKKYCDSEDKIIEVGTLSAHHLVLLGQEKYKYLYGIDFVEGAIKMGKKWNDEFDLDINLKVGCFNSTSYDIKFDKIILFDVLEHQEDVKQFLNIVKTYCTKQTEVLFLVPKGEEYFDNCHINFYPSTKAFENVLNKYFKIIECYEVEDGKKLFARCTYE